MSLSAIPHSAFIIPHFLMVDDKVICDGAFLFFRRGGVRNEGGTQGGLFGHVAHGRIDDGGAFGGDFCSDYFAFAVYPNIHHDGAFFGEVVVWAVQALCATSSEAIARAVALSTIAFILSYAFDSVGVALVARLSRDAFRTSGLWGVAAMI